VQSIGYILKSLLGSVASEVKSGETIVYEHTFNVLAENPEHPSLTIAASQPGGTDYKYALAIASMLSLEISPDDLVRATASFIAASEAAKTGGEYVPAFSADDVFFRHQDITLKLAANVAGLGAATPIKVKSFKLDIPNGARVDQNVSELNPGNVLATAFEIKGSFELDYQNEDLHDAFVDGDYQALQISIARADLTIGDTSNPSLVITLPRISIEGWTPNRPIDDIVREQIEFTAHYDASEAKAITAVLTNKVADYDAEVES